jgi:DNA-binding NarL/FixJ family response regulator
MSIVQILAVDDFQPWQQFISGVLESEQDLKLIGFAHNGEDAFKKVAELQPDLVLMDISMPEMNGFEAAKKIRCAAPNSKILFVSEHRGSDLVQAAFDVGGSGYVLKSDLNDALIPAVRAVLRGQRFLSRSLVR